MASKNEIEILINATDRASSVLEGMLNRISGVGTNLMKIGAGITAATAPIALALGGAVTSAVNFDESMTNVGAVLGKGRDEMASYNEMVLRLGAASRAGPQAAAEAFYDIVGGISDSAAYFPILNSAISTAEAGSADLGATTNALISIMNSYQFAASDAAFASDVLTRTVGMGVGTMDQFASALPAVTGLAHSMSINFDDLAAATAYLTTQGNTASQATTQLSGMMSALLNPSTKMKDALADMGFTSGRAAVESLGLVGTYQAMIDKFGVDAVGPLVGQIEALRGITALTGDGFTDFSQKFVEGVDGATAAAQQIQLESPAAQFDLLQSKLSAMAIVVGQVLIPPLLRLADAIMPVVNQVLTWAQQNPQVMTTLVGIAMAAVTAGPVIGLVGTAITGVTTAIGILLSPAVLLAGAIAGIMVAAQIGYPGGIVGLFTDAAKTAQQLAFLGLYILNLAAQTARQGIEGLIGKGQEIINVLGELYEKSPEVHDALNKLALFAGIAAAAFLLLKVHYGMMAIAQGIVATGAWALAAAKMAVAAAATAASGGMTAFLATMAAAVAPILAVGAAIGIVIAGVNHFNDVTKEGKTAAETVVAQQAAKGNLTDEQLWQQTLASTKADMGKDNPFADAVARSIYSDLKAKKDAATGGAKALGGWMFGGRNYMVGENGPEIVQAPGNGANVVPNHQLEASGAGGGQGINIYVQMPEAALANPGVAYGMGREFGAGIKEEMNNRGIRR